MAALKVGLNMNILHHTSNKIENTVVFADIFNLPIEKTQFFTKVYARLKKAGITCGNAKINFHESL